MTNFNFHTKHLWVTTAILLGTVLTISPANAAPITFNFTGAVSGIGTQINPSGGPFSLSQAVTGSYTFDSSTSNTGAGNTGTYSGTLSSFNVTIGTYVASLAAGANSIVVTNPINSINDSYRVLGLFSGDSVNGNAPASFELELKGPSSSFSNVLLPTTPPSVSSFATKEFRLLFGNGAASRVLTVTVSQLTAVPLPAAVILFGAGLVALAGLGAGNRRQRNTRIIA